MDKIELTRTEYRSHVTGNKVEKTNKGWRDTKTNEDLLDYQVYKFVSLFAKIK